MLGILKFPLWLLSRLVGRKKKVREERKEKQRKYVRNFSLVNYSWQKRTGKKLTEKQKEYYRKKRKKVKKEGKFSRKKTNNSSPH